MRINEQTPNGARGCVDGNLKVRADWGARVDISLACQLFQGRSGWAAACRGE